MTASIPAIAAKSIAREETASAGVCSVTANRRALWIVGSATIVAQLIGSAFNIWYNLTQIKPLLGPEQYERFQQAVGVFNVLVYPIAIGFWVRIVMSLREPMRMVCSGDALYGEQLLAAQRRVINLPWWSMAVAAPAWFMCIPTFLITLATSPTPVSPAVFINLPVSIIISALIAVTHGFFAVELLSLHLLYPPFFINDRPSRITGALALSLRGRGVMWALSAGVCPIASLILLQVAEARTGQHNPLFNISVGLLGILFGLATAWMLGRLVTEPVTELREAAREVAAGNLSVQVNLKRADEFGPLIDEFNTLVVELREKQALQETFGRHVGREAARQILSRGGGIGGAEQVISVMFADLRNFTARCSECSPGEAVRMLNLFLTDMVEIVEQRHGGMVNKFLGDGFMALFGAGAEDRQHADDALHAGLEILERMDDINARLESDGIAPLGIGIGIHTGPALVGSIGSDRRLEYTAIGDTVNVASRVESLNKQVSSSLLLTRCTYEALSDRGSLQKFPAQKVKGISEPVAIFGIPLPQPAR